MAIQDDLSRGSYLLTQKPFQIEAWTYPFRYVPVRDANGDLEVFTTQKPASEITPVSESIVGKFLEADLGNGTYNYYEVVEDFDFEIWDSSEFTSFMFSINTLDQLRDTQGARDIGDRKYNPLVNVNKNGGELTALEQSKLDNIIRIQWHDDDFHPNNSLVNASGEVLTDPGATGPFDSIEPPSIIGIGRDYFNAKRNDPDFDDIILSIDPPPFGYSDAQWTEYINAIQPDLIMHNNYPWQALDGLNRRQVEYGMYSRAILWSGRAQAGGDALNPVAKPIAWGGFLQTCGLFGPGIMPYSFRKYQAFFYLTFGAKFLSAFVYNDLPNSHELGIESYLFDQKGVPLQEDPNPTPQFFEQAELNRKLKIVGNTLKLLNATGQRFIRATNIEFNVPQGLGFAGGIYDWEYGTRPDTRLTDVIVSRDDFPDTQDVWVGYFEPIHNSLDGSGTTDETYFMICNGSWDEDDSLNIRQRIRMEFDFGTDDSITNIIKLSTETGKLEVIPLIPMGGNTYYYEHVLEAGEADLFKYDTGVQFLGDPIPQVEQLDGIDYSPPFNYPGGVRVSNDDPIDADRYIQNSIAERNLLVTQGRAKEGQQCYVKNIGDNTSELYVLRGTTNLDWQPIWKSPFQLADMYKQTYDKNNSGAVDNAELLSGRQLNELPAPDSVVARDENGDIEVRLLKSAYPEQISISEFAQVGMRNNEDDNNNFLRYVTKGGFRDWLEFNKIYIDALGINASHLSGKVLDYSPVPDTVAGRDADGAINSTIFKTADWEITQVDGALVLVGDISGTIYTVQFPTTKGGTVAMLSDINKTVIDALGIAAATAANADKLSNKILNYAPVPDTVAGRDTDGAIASTIFKTTDWEITQNAGVLVFKNTQTGIDYELAMPISESGVIATKAYADKYYWEDAYLITGQSITANTDTTITLTSATIENSGNLTGVIGTNGTITPTILNGWIDVTITFNFATPATQGYLDVFLEVDGVKYRNNHHNMGKSNGVIDTVTSTFGLPIKSTFFTNGGIMKINSSENITITDKYVAIKI